MYLGSLSHGIVLVGLLFLLTYISLLHRDVVLVVLELTIFVDVNNVDLQDVSTVTNFAVTDGKRYREEILEFVIKSVVVCNAHLLI